LDNLFNFGTINVNYVKLYCVKLNVEDTIVDFQIDTGSSVTVINVDDLKYYGTEYFGQVEQSNIRLKTYNNTIIVPIGVLEVKVKYNNLYRCLKMVVVKEGGPPIISQEWLTEFKITMYSDIYLSTKLSS